MKKIIGFGIMWWLCLIATYLCYGLKPAIMAFLTSGIGALAIVADQKNDAEENEDDDSESD